MLPGELMMVQGCTGTISQDDNAVQAPYNGITLVWVLCKSTLLVCIISCARASPHPHPISVLFWSDYTYLDYFQNVINLQR